MDTIDKLNAITNRVEHLQSVAEWIARETVHTDNGISQSGTLICALATDVKNQINDILRMFEEVMELELH